MRKLEVTPMNDSTANVYNGKYFKTRMVCYHIELRGAPSFV